MLPRDGHDTTPTPPTGDDETRHNALRDTESEAGPSAQEVERTSAELKEELIQEARMAIDKLKERLGRLRDALKETGNAVIIRRAEYFLSKLDSALLEYARAEADADQIVEKEVRSKMKDVYRLEDELKRFESSEAELTDELAEKIKNLTLRIESLLTKLKTKEREVGEGGADAELENMREELVKLLQERQNLENERGIRDVHDLPSLIAKLEEIGILVDSRGQSHDLDGMIQCFKLVESGEMPVPTPNSFMVRSVPTHILREKVREIFSRMAPEVEDNAPEAEQTAEKPTLADLRNRYATKVAIVIRKYGSAVGWIRRLVDKRGYMEAITAEERAYTEYGAERAVTVLAAVHSAMTEQIALADARAREMTAQRGQLGEIGKKLYDIYKGKKSRAARLALSGGLLAGSFLIGGFGGLGAVLAIRRTVGGIGSTVGSYDLLRMITEAGPVKLSKERKTRLKGKKKEEGLGLVSRLFNGGKRARYDELRAGLEAEQIKEMSGPELDVAITKLETTLVLDGKAPSQDRLYVSLIKERGERLSVGFARVTPSTEGGGAAEVGAAEAEAARANRVRDALSRFMIEVDEATERRIIDVAAMRAVLKVAAVGVGALIASGALQELLRGALGGKGAVHAVAGHDQAATSAARGTVAEGDAKPAAADVADSTPRAESAPAAEAPTGIIPGRSDVNQNVALLAEIKAGSGKGVLHVFRAQLERDPQAFGFQGDSTNASAVRKWASRLATKIARDHGMLDKGVHLPKGKSAWFILDRQADGEIIVNIRGSSDMDMYERAQAATEARVASQPPKPTALAPGPTAPVAEGGGIRLVQIEREIEMIFGKGESKIDPSVFGITDKVDQGQFYTEEVVLTEHFKGNVRFFHAGEEFVGLVYGQSVGITDASLFRERILNMDFAELLRGAHTIDRYDTILARARKIFQMREAIKSLQTTGGGPSVVAEKVTAIKKAVNLLVAATNKLAKAAVLKPIK